MRERLDVEHKRWRAADATFVRARRRERRQRRTAVQELNEGGLLARNEPVRNDCCLQLDASLVAALPQGVDERSVSDRGRRHNDMLRADRTRREECAVDDEMRSVGEQHLVFPGRWLSLGAVRDDDRSRAGASHRLELRGRREAGAATPGQTGVGDSLAELARIELHRKLTAELAMGSQRHCASIRSDAVEEARR